MPLITKFVMNTLIHKMWKKIGVITLLSCCLSAVVYSDESVHVIRGTQDNDDLRGTSFADEIYGGKGDDIIYGGAGADILFGGAGADQFIIKTSELDTVDTIKDFNPNEGDTIILHFQSSSIKDIRIPQELGTSNIKFDKNGNLKLLLDSQDWMTLLKVENTNTYFQIENDSNFIRFVFDKKF